MDLRLVDLLDVRGGGREGGGEGRVRVVLVALGVFGVRAL